MTARGLRAGFLASARRPPSWRRLLVVTVRDGAAQPRSLRFTVSKTKAGKRQRRPAPQRPSRAIDVRLEPGPQPRVRPVTRHLTVLAMAAALVWFFWSTRPTWDGEMRLWKAVGDAAFVLLLVTLSLGPLSRLAGPVTRLLPWRRQLGIWFALVATVHGVLVVHGWARWSLRRFLGYEVVPQLGREVRLEPGFGLANLVGITALLLALVLAATSSDRALRRLGTPAWKWLHHSALFVLYLSILHGGYFLFLHYTASFHKQIPPADWFRFPFVALGGAVVLLQVGTFLRTATLSHRTAAR